MGKVHRHDEDHRQPKGYAIDEVVLIVDGRQQHDQQGQHEEQTSASWENEEPTLHQDNLVRGRQATTQPAVITRRPETPSYERFSRG